MLDQVRHLARRADDQAAIQRGAGDVAMLDGTLMRRFRSFLGCLTLLLMMWTGVAAHAAEAMECASTSSIEASAHFEGDGDQVPSDSDSPVPHHHGGCHGHHVNIPSNTSSVRIMIDGEATVSLAFTRGLIGTEPDTALRPPKA